MTWISVDLGLLIGSGPDGIPWWDGGGPLCKAWLCVAEDGGRPDGGLELEVSPGGGGRRLPPPRDDEWSPKGFCPDEWWLPWKLLLCAIPGLEEAPKDPTKGEMRLLEPTLPCAGGGACAGGGPDDDGWWWDKWCWLPKRWCVGAEPEITNNYICSFALWIMILWWRIDV